MKILLVTDAYSHLTNGVAVVVATLKDAYRIKGHDVRILTMSGDRHSHRDGEVYYMGSFAVPLYPDVRMSLIHRHPYLKELKNWKPDIVHIHTEASSARMARSIAKATGAPVVMTWHTDYAKFAFRKHSSLGIIKFTAKVMMSAVSRGARIITVPSHKAKSILESYSVNRPSTVIPNGIILRRYKRELKPNDRAQLMEKYNLTEDNKIMVIVSRLSSEKNLSELIEFFPKVLEQIPELRMVIAGIGPDEKHLQSLTEKLGLSDKITFVGFIPPEQTYRIYKLGDVFLSASTFEMHSMTYLEAMACGLPLICRDDPCLQDVLYDGVNGYRYSTEEEFVEKAVTILRDDELRKSMAKASLEHADDFSEDAFADRMLALYKETIAAAAQELKNAAV